MNYRLFNIKSGLYESEITNYNYIYSVDAVKETLKDNPSIFVENSGNWIFTEDKAVEKYGSLESAVFEMDAYVSSLKIENDTLRDMINWDCIYEEE
mgnify:FL=1|jgi:predicted GH43/DUF377 family glycosyl hydrolase|tara:strand:+ start:3180 stop:3467 length:288 start_codon:yes stop_codon:yes gene_type:complete